MIQLRIASGTCSRHSRTSGGDSASQEFHQSAGPIGSLADLTGASAGITSPRSGALAASVDYTIKFLTEARGDELVARGRVLRPGSTLTVATVEISAVTSNLETLCATALIKIRTIKPT